MSSIIGEDKLRPYKYYLEVGPGSGSVEEIGLQASKFEVFILYKVKL